MVGCVLVIVGVGMNNMKEMIEKVKYFVFLGVDVFLVIIFYYNKISDVGLVVYFIVIVELLLILFILYNVFFRIGMLILIYVLVNLVEYFNIIGLKEVLGDMVYVMEVVWLISEKFSFYSGNDDLILLVMSVGGSGVISVWVNI